MTKANKDGWIRWKGGVCPVDCGVLVDVRYRDKSTKERLPALELVPGKMATDWDHTGEVGDIMAYRLHKPEEVRPTEADPSVVEAKQAPKFDPVALRDEVKVMRFLIVEHQAEIAKITARIEEIEIELDNEGFALVEKPQQKQALPDMDDPANWRVGDVLLVTSTEDSIAGSSLHEGELVNVIERSSIHERRITVKTISGKVQHLEPSCFEFHSRP